MMDRRELQQYEKWKEEVQSLRWENQHLRLELMACRPALYHASQEVADLRERVAELTAENELLRRRVEGLMAGLAPPAPPAGATAGTAAAAPAAVPSFVKPDRPDRERKRPGRKPGHPAALRPRPAVIDEHVEVPLPAGDGGRPACPDCLTPLTELKGHERLVEDVVPAKVVVTCYHTTSGFCPCCGGRVESRAPGQPPPADVPQAQLGLNALSLASLLRVEYRLPFRQVSRLLSDVAGLRACAGGLARQLQRAAGAMAGEYERLKALARSGEAVHVDETSWRTDGRNGWLWVMTGERATVFHVDRSRGGDVAKGLLGGGYAGTLVTDFLTAYNAPECAKQKCLTHLLRELRETAAAAPAFAAGRFYPRCKRLARAALALKRRKPAGPVRGEGAPGQQTPEAAAAARYAARAKRLEARLKALGEAEWEEPESARLAARLRRHEGELTRFLWHDAVDGTNNAAERALRPAVVARKISGGSRGDAGATAFATVASVLRSARQQGRHLLGTVKALLTGHWAGQAPGLLCGTPPAADAASPATP